LASRWWIFIGCACICSGILLPVGIIILVFYFIDYIFKRDTPLVNTGTQYIDNHYTQNIGEAKFNTFNQTGDDKTDPDDEEMQTFNKSKPMEYMDDKTREDNK
tara:strand:- start:87 stop:395 length:309 start_codon:yes stop_codon:yes gene_type:complete